jgi:catechol 2,3-dioxygenase-like lactoylglutathione lyase family enzyme
MPVQVKPGPPGLLGVTIGCTDIDRSRRFYEEIVELGDFVDLVPAEGEAPPAANTLGAWRMALATEDIDADVSQLRARGVSCLSEPAEMEMGPGLPALRFVLFPDPDGTMLELIERRPA